MLMEFEGYKVSWSDSRKYITYTTPDGNKCRDIKLFDNKFLKESMENEFTIRTKITSGFAYRGTAESENSGNLCTLRIHNGTELESVNSGAQYSGEGTSGHRGEASVACYPTAANRKHAVTSGNTHNSYSEYEDGDLSVQFKSSGTYGGNEEISGEISDGYRETGWKNERAIFTESLIREAEAQKAYNETYAHSSDTHSASHSLGADTAFLIGALSEIIGKDDESDDCTTWSVITERKNYMKKRNRNNHDSGMNMNM